MTPMSRLVRDIKERGDEFGVNLNSVRRKRNNIFIYQKDEIDMPRIWC